jgi:hypothetical protein
MSAVCVLTPMLIGAWPAVSAAIASAAASLGFSVVSSRSAEREQESPENTVETDLPNSEIVDARAGESQTMRIVQGDVTVEFRRDARGACRLCVSGNRSKSELRRVGEEVAGRVAQQFAYHKLVSELKKHNYSVVEESVLKDESIRVRVRLGG